VTDGQVDATDAQAGATEGQVDATDAQAGATAVPAAAVAPRSAADGGVVELREVTAETVRAICRLSVAPDQIGFVAPNAVSFAEALFEPKAWYRAIYADDDPAGFVMLAIDRDKPEYYLWRLMIAAEFQRRGYGRAALALIVDHVRALPRATELLVSWVPAAGGPEPFYRSLGFVPTGAVDEGEVVARLAL
jgi:diamine N-acetyltransferase